MKKLILLFLFFPLLAGAQVSIQEKAHQVFDSAELGKKIVDSKSLDKLEIISIREIPKGVELYFRAWDFRGTPYGFGDGSVEIERVRIINPPLRVTTGKLVFGEIDGEAILLPETVEDSKSALYQVLGGLVTRTGFLNPDVEIGKIGRSTCIAYPNAGTGTAPIDGAQARIAVNETFAVIQPGAGNASDDTAVAHNLGIITASAVASQYNNLQRYGVGFPTDGCGIADGTIDSATVSFAGVSATTGLGDTDLDLVAFSPISGSDFVNADFANYGATRLSTGIAISSWTTDSSYNDYDLNSTGLAHIATSTNTYFGTLLKWDLDVSFGGVWASGLFSRGGAKSADQAGTAIDPMITITFTPEQTDDEKLADALDNLLIAGAVLLFLYTFFGFLKLLRYKKTGYAL